jgi:hypothetical protein
MKNKDSINLQNRLWLEKESDRFEFKTTVDNGLYVKTKPFSLTELKQMADTLQNIISAEVSK